ncbi:MAG: Ger(x)C family spore germination protein [Clostridia bacterium]|nr:Ger(x)C family spore germination protein [Clostridia bacterium]
MKCRFGLLVLLLITIIFTQGCWGSQETDELGYVILIGIDKGEKNIVKVSFQIAVPQPVEGGEQKKATEVVTVEAASIFGAKELASSFISKNLTFVHNKAVIVSEDIAKEGLSKYINPLVRCRELRRTNYLTVVRGEASEFLEHNKELIFEKYTSRYIDLLMNASKFTGFVPESNIHKFYQGLKSPGLQPITALMAVKNKEDDKITKGQDIGNEKKAEEEMAYLPGDIPRKGGAKIEIIGQVVFRDDKLVGFLNGKETRYYQMLTGDFQKEYLLFQIRKNLIRV